MKEFIDNIGKEIRLKGKVWVEQVWNLTANKSIGKIEKDVTGEILKSSKETNKECSTRLDEVAEVELGKKAWRCDNCSKRIWKRSNKNYLLAALTKLS